MTVNEPRSEVDKDATSAVTDPSHPSLQQEPSAAATSTARHNAVASKTDRLYVQGSTDNDGAAPVLPSASTKASLDEGIKKECSKLQHASVTRPFGPTVFASIPNESTSPDRNLASKTHARNPEGGGSVPGAIPVFLKATSDLEGREQTSLTVADYDTAIQNEIHIPRAFTVDDSPCYAEAFVTNDVENGDPSTKTEPPKPWTPAMRYGLIAGVLVVIALVVTLVVVFAVKPPSAANSQSSTNSPSAAKSQFVQYQVYWTTSLSPDFSPSSAEISDLEITCQAGGILTVQNITSEIDGGPPICTAENDSTIRCTQTPVQQANNEYVIYAVMPFQCHGTSPDQLVGQATLFESFISFGGGTFGNETYQATQLVLLQILNAKTGSFDLDNDCTGSLISIQDTDTTSRLFCGSEGSCKDDGNGCEIQLEGKSEVQRDPVNSKHIQDE